MPENDSLVICEEAKHFPPFLRKSGEANRPRVVKASATGDRRGCLRNRAPLAGGVARLGRGYRRQIANQIRDLAQACVYNIATSTVVRRRSHMSAYLLIPSINSFCFQLFLILSSSKFEAYVRSRRALSKKSSFALPLLPDLAPGRAGSAKIDP